MTYRTTLFLSLLFVGLSLPLSAQIEWLSWDEAMARNETEPRKILIDVYTDWCGWCKKMDKTTFRDSKVAAYVSENFYAVKFDAEQHDKIEFQGTTFEFNAEAGRRGAHTLAIALLDGKMSYPSIVYLDEQQRRISISPGFKQAAGYVKELEFIGGEHYRKQTYREFLESKK